MALQPQERAFCLLNANDHGGRQFSCIFSSSSCKRFVPQQQVQYPWFAGLARWPPKWFPFLDTVTLDIMVVSVRPIHSGGRPTFIGAPFHRNLPFASQLFASFPRDNFPWRNVPRYVTALCRSSHPVTHGALERAGGGPRDTTAAPYKSS